ncbi:hypothetical protein DYE50_00365 [Treponema ruminis]|uniref:Lipoprotein n=1 Tax=Treponema ruminis TaxID=744515 RepID=A0A7W8G780_9SPIR|nr:DUF4846 domain-containing protein [Treponema ruminis]MBB5225114.1 hypothetical protein [Treponema ruminis]QSI01035.1 hypothetical protein DYE50_00365 [Treponema ruminis]
MKKPFALIAVLLCLAPAFSHTHSLQLVQGEGKNIVERIKVPPKFKRIKAEPQSFAGYLRNYPLKEAASPLLLHNGNQKSNQEAHACIFDMPPESKLQENSQTIVRLYAQYLYASGKEKEISFHLTNGEICKWTEWLSDCERKRNLRKDVANDLKKWTKYEKPVSKKEKDEFFRSYLKNIFAHTSPLSMMEYESKSIEINQVRTGDILFDLNKPGYICMVVDICKNPETGEKAYLLAQSSSPASDFYVLKNPKLVNDPWYHEEDFRMPAETPEYLFPKDSWRRLSYLGN